MNASARSATHNRPRAASRDLAPLAPELFAGRSVVRRGDIIKERPQETLGTARSSIVQ